MQYLGKDVKNGDPPFVGVDIKTSECITMKPARDGRSLVTLCTYEERKEALKRTTIMEDDEHHRRTCVGSKERLSYPNSHTNSLSVRTNSDRQEKHNFTANIPQPPPEYVNSSLTTGSLSSSPMDKPGRESSVVQGSHFAQTLNPPTSPTPDYDNVQLISTKLKCGSLLPLLPSFTAGVTATISTATPTSAYGYRNLSINARESKNGANATVIPSSNDSSNSATGATGNRRSAKYSVAINEYDQPHRREPTKFAFLASNQHGKPCSIKNKTNNKNNIKYSTNNQTDSMRTELQSTLSRVKTHSRHMEHQSNCPLQQRYENLEYKHNTSAVSVEHLAKKLQSVSVAAGTSKAAKSVDSATYSALKGSIACGDLRSCSARIPSGFCNGNGPIGFGASTVSGTGILKNGNRNNSASAAGYAKCNEKTITFGN